MPFFPGTMNRDGGETGSPGKWTNLKKIGGAPAPPAPLRDDPGTRGCQFAGLRADHHAGIEPLSINAHRAAVAPADLDGRLG